MSLSSIVEEKLITGEELLEMADLGPCELVEGRIKPMSPTGSEHGFIEFRIAKCLDLFVESGKLGWILTGEVGIFTKRNPDSVRGADVAFISKKRLPQRPQRGFLAVAPELVVEIFSPTETSKEINRKIDEYLSIGVEWVWVVDPQQRTLAVYRANKDIEILTETDSLTGEGVLHGLELRIAKIFED